MPKPNLSEFEEMVRELANAPEPDSAFLDQLRARFLLTGAAASEVKRTARPAFWSPNMKRGLVAVLIVVLALLATSPAVADVIRSLLGYIPGVGLVEQDAAVLVLAEPVMIERDGVRLSVEQAVATNEKTVLIYRHVASQPYQPAQNYPVDPPRLRMPDGSTLEIIAGRRLGTEGEGILYALDFGPLPTGVTRVTLELVTLAGLRPGEAPENWAVSIGFRAGDSSDLTYPVYEAEQTSAIPEATQQAAHGLSLVIDNAVEMPDGYILMGFSEWTDASVSANSLLFDVLTIQDANGDPVPFEYAQSERYAEQGELRYYWAYKILTKGFAAPLQMEFFVKQYVAADSRFQFDPGPNPEHGQIWDLNLDVPVNDRLVKIISAEYSNQDPDFKLFRFTMSADGVTGAHIFDVDHPPLGFGGGGMPAVDTGFTTTMRVEGNPPYGPMTLSIVQLELLVPGDWTVTWDPSQP